MFRALKVLPVIFTAMYLVTSIFLFGQIIVSHESGFYKNPITVSIKSTLNGTIYYTLDGSAPQPGAARTLEYSKPLIIDRHESSTLVFIPTSPIWQAPSQNFPKAWILRIIEVKDGKIVDSTFRTYFIGIEHTLPVISIITDERNLFDEERGIYVPGKLFDPSNPYWTGNYHQRGSEWEREAVMEYFEGGILKYRTNIGIRIHGEFTRSLPIKSLRLYARNESKEFTYPFFGRTGYKKLLLRNAGNDWEYAYMRDMVASEIFKGLGFDTQDGYPVVHYINGEYWGIVYLMEYYDVRYLQVKYGVSEKNVVIVNYDMTLHDGKEGDEKLYSELIEYVKNTNFSERAELEKLKSMIDLDNFINFHVAEIIAANLDWPGNNERMWRTLKAEKVPLGDGRWRWMMYDMDLAFWEPEHDTFKVATSGNPTLPWTMNEYATVLLRKLLENEDVRALFFERLVEIFEKIFASGLATEVVEKYEKLLEPEMSLHSIRWGLPTYEQWKEEVSWLKEFFSLRRNYLNEVISSYQLQR
ncbi:CotH kinase family protein [Fervidobacterium thailandense]|uniref:Spore coat protein CotH n=1 Tax=Fervidobacterium thailandense TaxID=1008305 RepID=A0A1E3G320_9BACT|nr:CotH kinase family protein [Fervidobacterium thailandense]ODN30562.1 spore coat protein CotH [Fervidobacterium thailandense]